MMKYIVYLLVVLMQGTTGNAQLLDKIKNRTKQKAEDKVLQKTDGVMEHAVEGKHSAKSATTGNQSPQPIPENKQQKSDTVPDTVPSDQPSFAVYSKFDFIPGAKMLVMEDFSQDAVGDFPGKWNTNASGEVVKAEGLDGKWLKLDLPGVYMPEYIKELPENFTLEMDILCNPGFRYGSSPLYVGIASLKTPQEYLKWQQGNAGRKGFNTWLMPTSASGIGKAGFEYYTQNAEDASQSETDRFQAKGKNKVRLSIWRQKQRVRVYLDEVKMADVARGLDPGNYNAVVFALNTAKTQPDQYLISNIRIAVGAPDARNKLLTEGKFSTNGILFDVNSDKIKPQSYGVLKDIGGVLKDNAEMKIKIIGHTDGDGDAAANLKLSEKRAAAVKAVLLKEFAIEEARMQTAGKGETELLEKETSAAAKANNRRVEFIRIP